MTETYLRSWRVIVTRSDPKTNTIHEHDFQFLGAPFL